MRGFARSLALLCAVGLLVVACTQEPPPELLPQYAPLGPADLAPSPPPPRPAKPEVPPRWLVDGTEVLLEGTPVHFYGVNWFGLETSDYAPHGLWTGRPLGDFAHQIAELGFNAVRVPVAPGSIRPGVSTSKWAQTTGLRTGREALLATLAALNSNGLYILLDYHSCDDAHGENQAPTPLDCEGATASDWHHDLRNLAALGREFENIVGIDLFNEPYGWTWAQWARHAEEAAHHVLEENPDLLVFVQGVGNNSDTGGHPVNWGENLTEAAKDPLQIPASKLVYAPHAYGPSVAEMPQFYTPDYPKNLPPIWDAHFGHLAPHQATVIGEYGSRYDEAEVPGSTVWQDAFIDYLTQLPIAGTFYWAFNANTSQVSGVLQEDWTTPATPQLNSLTPLTR